MAHASGEAVDLWLDPGLYLDVKLDEQQKNILYQYEINRWNAICEAIQEQKQDQPNQQIDIPPKPTYDAIRSWRVATVLSVHHRSILVKFTDPGIENQLINVDEGYHRFAELYTRSSQDVSNDKPITAGIDCVKLFNEIVEHHSFEQINIQQECNKFCKRFFNQLTQPTDSSNLTTHSNQRSNASSPILVDSDNDMDHSNISSDPSKTVIDEDDDIQSQSISLPLYDPLTHERITVPVRSRNCSHASAFDLMTHLTHNNESNSIIWVCPICKNEALADELIIDKFLYAILCTLSHSTKATLVNSRCLSSSGSLVLAPPHHDAVKVYVSEQLVVDANGEWRVGQERERRKRKFHRTLSTSSDHPSVPSCSDNLSGTYRDPPFPFSFAETYDAVHDVQVIDLSSDDPFDKQLLAWLSDRIQVKIEKQTVAKRAQMEQELKSNEEAAARARVTTFPVFHSINQTYSSPNSAQQQHWQLNNQLPYYPQYPYPHQIHQISHGALPAMWNQNVHPPFALPVTAPQTVPNSARLSMPTQSDHVGSSPVAFHSTHQLTSHIQTAVHNTLPYPRVHAVPFSASTAPARRQIDINTATSKDLTGLGVSWTLASRIIEERARRGPAGYVSMKELCEIKGIGPKTVEKLVAHGACVCR